MNANGVVPQVSSSTTQGGPEHRGNCARVSAGMNGFVVPFYNTTEDCCHMVQFVWHDTT